jgi:hypothetical protein
MEMVPWLLDKLPPDAIAELLSSFPPVAGQRYQDWKRSYDAKPRW